MLYSHPSQWSAIPLGQSVRGTRSGTIVALDCGAASASALHGADFLEQLDQALRRIEEGDAPDIVMLGGLGLAQYDASPVRPDMRLYNKREQLLARIRKLPGIVVAAVDGLCTGLQLELALAADFCLATPDSSFAVPELMQGYLPGAGTVRMAQLIGLKPARRLMFSASPCGARAALELGLIDEICASGEMASRVEAVFGHLPAQSRLALGLCRRLLDESFSTSHEDALGHFMAAQHRCFSALDCG